MTKFKPHRVTYYSGKCTYKALIGELLTLNGIRIPASSRRGPGCSGVHGPGEQQGRGAERLKHVTERFRGSINIGKVTSACGRPQVTHAETTGYVGDRTKRPASAADAGGPAFFGLYPSVCPPCTVPQIGRSARGGRRRTQKSGVWRYGKVRR